MKKSPLILSTLAISHDGAGSPVDDEFSSDSWYDWAKLDAFVLAHK